MDKKTQLLAMIQKRAYKKGSQFKTPSKVVSSYFDFFQISMKHTGIELAGDLLYEEIKDLDICALGGVSSGIFSVQCRAAFLKKIGVFFIRESMKKEGDIRDPRWIQSRIRANDRVALAADVVSSGSQVIRGVEEIIQFGAHIEKIIVMIDSEDGNGIENITGFIQTNLLNIPITTLFTRSDIVG